MISLKKKKEHKKCCIIGKSVWPWLWNVPKNHQFCGKNNLNELPILLLVLKQTTKDEKLKKIKAFHLGEGICEVQEIPRRNRHVVSGINYHWTTQDCDLPQLEAELEVKSATTHEEKKIKINRERFLLI